MFCMRYSDVLYPPMMFRPILFRHRPASRAYHSMNDHHFHNPPLHAVVPAVILAASAATVLANIRLWKSQGFICR